MKKYIIALLLLIGCGNANIEKDMGRASLVSDGDTFWFKPNDGSRFYKIRLAYIDAPEYGQPFSLAAFYVLDSLIEKKQVIVEKVAIDKYNRTVAIVYLPSMEESVNEFMVKRGMAWTYEEFSPDKLCKQMLEAKSRKKGLWQNPYPESPYEYRKKYKE